MLESKEIYIVNNKEFTDKETAEYYLDLCEAREQYHNTAKNYEEVLNKCECKEKVFVEKVQRDYGKSYQDEFDNWHSERIDVENYRCKCCGKSWTYADFDGKGLCWKHGGNILVKRGTF